MQNFFHFDRYQCTFPKNLSLKDICRQLNFISAPAETYPRGRGYRKAISFGDAAFLMHDPVGDYGCHLLIGGGDTCEPIVDELRFRLSDHRVSRADVAVDYDYEGSFDDLEKIGLKIALEHKPKPLSTTVAGDHYQLKTGRTTYFGSRSSTHFARVYEKGHEQRKKGINPDVSLSWSRFEIEVKPTKKGDARSKAACMSPDEVAHSSAWTSSLAYALGSNCVDAVKLSTKKVRSDFFTTLHHMAAQYGPGIRKAIAEGEVTSKELMIFFRKTLILGESPSKNDFFF